MPTDVPDLINNEDSQLGKMVALLESAGYNAADGVEPDALGHQEYMIGVAGNKKMLTLGAGRGGDEGAYTVFYFTIESEELVEHASNFED